MVSCLEWLNQFKKEDKVFYSRKQHSAPGDWVQQSMGLIGLYAKFTSPKMNFCLVNKILTCIFQEISNTIVHVRNAERGTKKNEPWHEISNNVAFEMCRLGRASAAFC